MIQDLSDISVLGKGNIPLLDAIKFDITLLDLIAETSSKMASLLAAAKGEQGNYSKALDIRNRAYTYLKIAVDEIRACGKYTFVQNEVRLKGYRSEYMHNHYMKYKITKPNENSNAA